MGLADEIVEAAETNGKIFELCHDRPDLSEHDGTIIAVSKVTIPA